MAYHQDNGICFVFVFLRWAKQLEVDTIAPMALVLSLFFPFYVSVVTVGAVAVMTMVNYRMRTRALESPYGKLLMGVLIAPFFVSAIYNNYMGMLYSMLVLAAVVCAFYLRSVMTGALFNRMMDAACVASVFCAAIAFVQKAASFAVSPGLPACLYVFQCQLLWHDDRISRDNRTLSHLYQFKRAHFLWGCDCHQLNRALSLRQHVGVYGTAVCGFGVVLFEEVLQMDGCLFDVCWLSGYIQPIIPHPFSKSGSDR